MNIGQFYTRISAAIKRGTSQDVMIPLWVSDAANLLEMNYTFSWMNYTSSATVVASSMTPNEIPMPARVKSFEWIKPVINQQGNYIWWGEPLVGTVSQSFLGITGGNPSGYYLDGLDTIVLDALPGVDRSYLLNYNQYTDWPVDDAATPHLLQRGQSVLTAQTLLLAAMEMKDARMEQAYEARLETAIGFLLRSEEELKMHHQQNLAMRYSGLG